MAPVPQNDIETMSQGTKPDLTFIIVMSVVLVIGVTALAIICWNVFKRLNRISTYFTLFKAKLNSLKSEETPITATNQNQGLRFNGGMPQQLPPVYGAWNHYSHRPQASQLVVEEGQYYGHVLPPYSSAY